VLEGTGHGYYVESAEEVNRLVLDFVSRHKLRDKFPGRAE
jgi:hypothetical protein